MPLTSWALAGALLLTLAASGGARQETKPDENRWRTLEAEGAEPLRYVLVLPPGFDPGVGTPVLLALPPGGQDEDMVERGLELYFEAEAMRRGWVVVSPAAPAGQSFFGGAEARLPALPDAVASEIRFEGGAVYLAGVSNGGRAAFRLAGLYPERFLSVTVLPGAPATAEDEGRLSALADLPVTLFVGEEDGGWHEAALETLAKLEALGAEDVLLEVRAGEGHVLDGAVGALVFDRLDALRGAATGGATPEQRWFDWTRLQFPPGVHAARRARLAEALGGGVFLAPSREGLSQGETFRQADDFLYFTGLELPHSVLALDAKTGQATLFTPDRDARFESTQRPNDFPGRPLGSDPDLQSESGVDAVRSISSLEGALDGWIAEGRALWLDPGRAGLAETTPSGPFAVRDEQQAFEAFLRSRFPDASLEDAASAVARLRMVKGPEEIERIRRACAVTASAMTEAARAIRPGVDERTLEGVLEGAFKRGGAQRNAFDSIIKSGPNSLWPWRILAAHYDRRNRAMASGELVIFDVGCEVEHYASDVGRTFPVSGSFTEDQARRLRMITGVSDAIFAAVRPGITLPELRALAESVIPPEERAHMQTGSFFGHHIGLDVGDASLLDAPLEAGMVFTIEPWYYDHRDEVAVFVEDVVLVTPTGAENLTADLPRGIEELESMVGPR